MRHILRFAVYHTVFLVWLASSLDEGVYSKLGPRTKFEKDFQETCSPYPFVRRYEDLMSKSRNKDTDEYMIYVFNEKNKGGNGGLGDRLGGLITAMAFALRTNRIFLMHGDKSFEESFRPYVGAADGSKHSWSNWEWAGWHSSFHKNMTFNRGCVNPRPGNLGCALDTEGKVDYSAYKVVRHRGNRAYLCRWGIRDSLGLREELTETLGITRQSDLYEVAGCMLRLAMWPTDILWNTLDQWLTGSVGMSTPISTQVGLHFRCGDASFGASRGGPTNSQCVFQSPDTWKGTSFADDYSLDSPMDEASCGKQVLRQYADRARGAGRVLAYIASDNADSARQINATMGWPISVTPTDSCHVDLAANPMCSRMTFVQWFMLSLSDKIVMQSLKNDPDANSPYHAVSDETRVLDAEYKKYGSQGPISAFSRYAAIYGLQKDGLRYGLGCKAINRTALSWQTQGNWLCGPKLFY